MYDKLATLWGKLIKICQPILSLPKGDKICHGILGAVITALVGFVFVSAGYGLIAGFLAGLIKEGIDEYQFRQGKHPTGANFFDFFATLLGVFVGGGVVVAIL